MAVDAEKAKERLRLYDVRRSQGATETSPGIPSFQGGVQPHHVFAIHWHNSMYVPSLILFDMLMSRMTLSLSLTHNLSFFSYWDFGGDCAVKLRVRHSIYSHYEYLHSVYLFGILAVFNQTARLWRQSGDA